MKNILKTFVKGLGAGSAIAVGSILFVLSSAFVANGKLLGSVLFSVGLLTVCFCALNLYTGKIGFLFNKKDKKSFILDLFIMLIANILVSFLIGFIFSFITKGNQLSETLKSLYATKTNKTIFDSLVSSFMCGIFVYSAVFCYQNFKRKPFKAIGIIVSVFLFVYMGFDHCIANSFYFAAANQLGNSTTYISLALSILGNSLGALFVNCLLSK